MSLTPGRVLAARPVPVDVDQLDLFAQDAPDVDPGPAECSDPDTCTDHDPCPPCLAEARAAGLAPAGDTNQNTEGN
ncbi:MAG: hypothetical protein JWO67_4124 [Streptosporangiaceae bacterium]|nr:hypothetical protein [Streptosporangiaceae bacterium]